MLVPEILADRSARENTFTISGSQNQVLMRMLQHRILPSAIENILVMPDRDDAGIGKTGEDTAGSVGIKNLLLHINMPESFRL